MDHPPSTATAGMSSSGGGTPGRRQRTLPRAFTMRTEYSGEDMEKSELELVPSSLEPIIPILRAAKEIEEENPRVAYLCAYYSYRIC